MRLALASLRARLGSAVLCVATVALSFALWLAVEQVRAQGRVALSRSVSGIDLVIGARAHPVHLLLFSVFRIGDATQDLSMATLDAVRDTRHVAWLVPISLGDSHRGFRVVGTTDEYFQRLRRPGAPRAGLVVATGSTFAGADTAVLGAAVARALGYTVGDRLVLTHGTGPALRSHDAHPFRVVGVLEATGTPVDAAIHVPLEGIDAIHAGWADARAGAMPRRATAAFVGLTAPQAVFLVKRRIEQAREEPMSAILPGVAVQQLGQLVSGAERALATTAACVVGAGLAAILAALVAGLRERRREMAILRAIGAGPWRIGGLLVLEAQLLVALGLALGILLTLATALAFRQPVLEATGLALDPADVLGHATWLRAGAVLVVTLLVSLVPALIATRRAIADGFGVHA